MATNNIVFARNLDGSPLKVNDIKVGLKVTFPAATGGVFSYKCVSVNSIEAVFDNCNKEWPTVEKISFNVDDLTDEEFEKVQLALNALNSWSLFVTKEDRVLLHRAEGLGYVKLRSYTQGNWSENGIKRYKKRL